MAMKGLKPTAVSRPSARDALAAADSVAQAEGMPPATLKRHPASPPTAAASASAPAAAAEEGLVQLNIRVRSSLGDQLADRARAEGVTQKVLVCRALKVAGFDVAEEDLRAAPAPRRRGTR